MKINLVLDDLNERPIEEYKTFFKKYLTQIKNRPIVLNKLHQLCIKFQNQQKGKYFLDRESNLIKKEAREFVQHYLGNELLTLFDKSIDFKEKKRIANQDDHILLKILSGFVEVFENVNEGYKADWNYKTNFLLYIYSCYYYFGLHTNISNRDPEKYKRYNLVVYHHHNSKVPVAASKILMSKEEFHTGFTKLYLKRKPLKFGGILIPFNKINEVKISTTLLKDDEIELFALKNNFVWNKDKRDLMGLVNNCPDETERYHPNPYDEEEYEKGINAVLVQDTISSLSLYPIPYKVYKEAIEKFQSGNYQRNILDDCRLTLELVLKELFKNKKSLENQISNVGNYQIKRGASPELTNMFVKILDYYSKYQNNYVKHEDLVKKDEIEIILNLSSTFIKYLINK